MSSDPKDRRMHRVQVGVEYGLAMAVVLILWAGGAWMVMGGPAPEEDFPFSFGGLATLYLFGGVSGGAIGGAVFHWARTRRKAFLVGTLTTMPFFFLASLPLVWFEAQDMLEFWFVTVFTTVLGSLTLGGTCGITIFYPKARSLSSEDGGK